MIMPILTSFFCIGASLAAISAPFHEPTASKFWFKIDHKLKAVPMKTNKIPEIEYHIEQSIKSHNQT